MIYEIRHSAYNGEKTEVKIYKVNDLIMFARQPKSFKEVFTELSVNNIAEFDSATVIVFDTGRVIVTEKFEENE